MEETGKLLTIGQFAALHGINKKTLMWYDEIGLFKPALVNPENGYRFYSYHQSSLLETILLLRELDVSIDEIQNFMNDRCAESLSKLLAEKIAGLDAKIAHLKAVRKTLCNYQKNMKNLLTMDLSSIEIVHKEECCLVTVDIDREISYDREVEMITTKTQEYQLRRLHDASYGTMISVESLYQGNFEDYSRLFIEIPFPIQKAGLHIQPCGDYLRAFYQGDWDKLPQKYKEIFAYTEKYGLKLCGFSYEKIINENVTDFREDYIVQIEIPLCSSSR